MSPAAEDPREPTVDNFDRFSSAKYFECFDGMRALAVLSVLVYHCPVLGLGFADRWQKAGDLGVDLFFVMSGFLITTLMLRERPAPIGGRLKRFYMRRALRIFPVYYLAIGIYWLSTYFLAPHRLAVYEEYVPWLLAYLSDYKLALQPDPFPVFGHAWSLAVEEKFYLFWPLIVMALSERRAMQICIACIAFGIGLRAWVEMGYDGAVIGRLYYAFDTRFDSLMWGALLAFGLRSRAFFNRLEPFARPGVLVAVVLAILAYSPFAGNGSHHRYVVIPILSLAVLTLYLLRPGLPGSRFLNGKWLIYIGQVSYGIYIFHPLAISVSKRGAEMVTAQPMAQAALIIVGSTVLSVIAAGLSFRFFESWFLKLKSRYR